LAGGNTGMAVQLFIGAVIVLVISIAGAWAIFKGI